MNIPLRRLILSVGLLFATCAAIADDSAAGPMPFDVIYHGHFKNMKQASDVSGKVDISALPDTRGTWGVGATAGLKGEIVQIDGKILVSPGSDAKGGLRTPLPNERAALFVSAKADNWQEIKVPREMNQTRFEEFVRAQAKTLGLDLNQPFPLRVEGNFRELVWHVLTGELAAAHAGSPAVHTGSPAALADGSAGHARKRIGMRIFNHPHRRGQLIGIYSGEALDGVVSHPGERFHLHFVDDTVTTSGHADAYVVRAGAVLKLPKR